ncbi:Ig-like domain-containing protein [Granulosicoccus antarcticus]|uniref:Dystroglycan-type cadherin-like domain-containing protein n=1 Tax=Granulosicoccus antarcticus IMCC3135 TaxID=1192854 RepID=A0A2Z2NWL8_9GAMM|nr:Ig-like domain-containing protein [Granulosicoccus antarcticus]ASJ75633.1 hypothetical protein IMCC3135_27900 [Granulosicoccus antarcticus IMCC3135]
MYNFTRTFTARLPVVLLLMNVSACGWVDSTGVQGTTVPVTLRNAQPVAVIEGTSLTAPLAGEGTELRNWSWRIEESDARGSCASISDFDENLSTTSLNDACSQEGGDCAVLMEESVDENNATQFKLTMPALRSPVALNYRLSAVRDDGAIVERQQLLCGLSVNEAPIANDDSYLVMLNNLLVINPSDNNNLLANDSDDDDIRNTQLTVTGITQAPQHASQFSFDQQGGFIYALAESAPVSTNGYTEDSFVYSISDGLHETQASAVIRIVAGNTLPVQLQKIPDLSIDAARTSSTAQAQQFDLSQYFIDIDGDSLSFTILNDQLPSSGSVTLDTDGQLHTLASLQDIGSYRLDINVSDGIDSISDAFILQIFEPEQLARNHSPDVIDISNKTVKNSFSYDVSGFFSDSDGDELTFSATGLPEDVTISTNGIISGESSKDNRGKWIIRVSADDGNGGTVEDGFQLQIK